MEQTPEKDEVLIARNNETRQVGAVVGQNPDGSFSLIPHPVKRSPKH